MSNVRKNVSLLAGKRAPQANVLSYFTGVPVKVYACQGPFLFTARLQNISGSTAQLSYFHSEGEADLLRWTAEPFEAELRGFSKTKYRAIRARGQVRHVLGGIWNITQITFTDSRDERQDDRLETNFNGTVAFPDRRNMEGACHVADISLGGVCLMMNHPTAAGERLLLHAAPLREAGIEALPCLVCYNRFDDEGRLLCGCRFEGLQEADRKKLAEFMEQFPQRGAS